MTGDWATPEDPTRPLFSREQRMREKPTPKDLFRIGAKDPVVKMALDAWQEGLMSWENSLLWMVVQLAHEKERLTDMVVLDLCKAPPPPAFVYDKNTVTDETQKR